jgi:hypothetical protein
MNKTEPKDDVMDWVVIILIACAMAAGVLFFAYPAYAEPNEPIRLCWEAPTADQADNPLSSENISHYEIEHGSALYETPDLHYDLTLTTYGEHCLRVRAYHIIEHVAPGAWSESKCLAVVAPPAAVRIREDCET